MFEKLLVYGQFLMHVQSMYNFGLCLNERTPAHVWKLCHPSSAYPDPDKDPEPGRRLAEECRPWLGKYSSASN